MEQEHDYTPTGFRDTANTLSCHQVGGLVSPSNPDLRPSGMGEFQAEHLLSAGYRLIYDPARAAEILADRK